MIGPSLVHAIPIDLIGIHFGYAFLSIIGGFRLSIN